LSAHLVGKELILELKRSVVVLQLVLLAILKYGGPVLVRVPLRVVMNWV